MVQKFYDDRKYDLAWTKDGKPTPQAIAFVQAIQNVAAKGLNPEDYDASLWTGRPQQLSEKNPAALAQFDVAMTISVMRLISDLHIGRVNPQHFNFEIDSASKKYDLPQFLTDKAIGAADVPQLLASVEPDSEVYRQTEQALVHYMDLAKQQQQANADPLPMVANPVSQGGSYPAAQELWQRLQLEGDAGDDDAPKTYNKALSDAVKTYQSRHGITDDGRLTPQTVKSLNVPLADRVTQLQDSLERWRWLPDPYLNARLMVNLPEFVLRGYNEEHTLDFTMKVVVGKVKGDHETPVFTHMMKYLIFRPYWNVPVDIAKKELVPHMEANKDYLASKNYEVTNNKGVVLPNYTVHQVEHAMVLVREKPGPGNSLGLVKFMFPNQYDIYLHSTPETYLFNRTRRDFSHGCVRVQKPDGLAVWVLQGQQDWDLDKVQEAMNTGPDNHQVNLKKQLPIVIFYLTAIPAEDGKTHFFDDIYGYDAALQAVLTKGMPYPKAPEPVIPKTKPGDTA
nr:L,D-transpeptidase family protein [Granulicella arctica]